MGLKISAVPGGTSPDSWRLPRTIVLGYFQPVPSGLSAEFSRRLFSPSITADKPKLVRSGPTPERLFPQPGLLGVKRGQQLFQAGGIVHLPTLLPAVNLP